MNIFKSGLGIVLVVLAVVAMLAGACGPREVSPTPSAPTGNQPPVISSLTAAQMTIHPSGNVEIRCAASDADGDQVSFKWACTGGSFSGGGSGTSVIWKAPANYGTYKITVTVEDGKGGLEQGSLDITVGPNQSPQISSLVANPSGVLYGGSATVSCVATDPDGDVVNYSWSASGGSISGVGDTVTWVAPNKGGNFYVKVIVSDGKGGETEGNVMIAVSAATMTVTITPVAEETGTVRSDGATDNSRTWAGDDEKDRGYCAFWSFDVWNLTGKNIQSASLKFGPYKQADDPFSSTTGLGGLRLWKVTYGDGLPGFRYTGSNLINVPVQNTPPTVLDITQEIVNVAAAAATRFQVEALFHNRVTNGNHVAQFIEWSEVVLEVTYSEK
jgi:hypothetical protein